MKKEERRKQIKEEIKSIIAERERLRFKNNSLKTELDHINGHYDKTWEEEYA